jgi:hypothetical protein
MWHHMPVVWLLTLKVQNLRPRLEHNGMLHVIQFSLTHLLGSKLKDGRLIMLDGILMHIPCVLKSFKVLSRRAEALKKQQRCV